MTILAPGTSVSISAVTATNAIPSDLGTFFCAGTASSGPVSVPVLVRNLNDYIGTFGNRDDTTTSMTLYDAIDTFFQEGGRLAYVSRVYGQAGITADTASHTFADQSGPPGANTIVVHANGPGAFGNNVTVSIAVNTSNGSFTITLVCPGYPTETSPALFTPQDAVNWATNESDLVSLSLSAGNTSIPPTNNPAATTTPVHLAGGANNSVAIASTDWQAALNAFISDLGMGQVAFPGQGGSGMATYYTMLLNHAQQFNRFALLDCAATQTTASAIEADALSATSAALDPSYGFMVAPYVLYPGLPTSTQTPPFLRSVPASGPVAGLMSRIAGLGANGDTAAAGQNGLLVHATDVADYFLDSDRAALDAAGVGVVRNYRGQVQLYGYTTLSTDPNWQDVGNSRLRMQIIDGVRSIGDQFVFADLDAQGHTLSAFGGMISSYLTALWQQSALYGLHPADAFFVNVGDSINTPVTATNRELLAEIAVRMSPTAEYVIISVTKYPVSIPLPS